MQDFTVPPEKRSIRNISIDRPQSGPENENQPTGPAMPPPEPPFPPLRGYRSRGSMSKWARIGIWGGVILACLIVLAVIVGSFFEGATVTITPRTALVTLDDSITVGATAGTNTIAYDIVEKTENLTRDVAATGEERIEHAASGRIVVYNNQDATSQKLIKNTRFETPEGLIFRIRDSITVPGQHKDAAGKTVPGSIEVDAFADSPGEEYNIGLTDFTIPAFEESGDERFETFYARSKTPMTGGFIGTVKTATESVTTAARTELKEALTTTSRASLETSLPEGFVLLPETITTTFEDLPNGDGTAEGTVAIGMKATTRAIAIDGLELARAVADLRVPEYANEAVRLADIRAFALTTDAPLSLAELPETFKVNIDGSGMVVWVFDADLLREDLAGISKSETESVFSRHDAVQKADVVVQPFWRRSMPDDPDTIEILEDTSTTSS